MILGTFLLGIIAVGFFSASIYNKLVTLRNRYRNAYAQIDVQLKRRWDLIPQLVETAKGYMSHERETLEAVIQARNQAASIGGNASNTPGEATVMKQIASAEHALTGALGRLLAIAESYPSLKADAHMQQLMEELTSTENRVGFARQAYNDAITLYNTEREKFPQVILANTFGFSEATQFFTITDEQEREVPKVSFS